MAEIKCINKEDLAIINDILANHIDNSNKRDELPPISHIEKMLDDGRCYPLAASLDNTAVGYLAYSFPSLYAAENLAYLYDIELSPGHRRKGVGRLLIKTLISQLKLDNVKKEFALLL